MHKIGLNYAQDVRELRDAGFNFPAANGYLLADAANWSSGQKAAVTRLHNTLVFRDEPEPEVKEERDEEIDDEFFFDQAEVFEEFEFDQLADLDEPWDEFIDDIADDYDGIEETDYEDTD